MNLVTVDKMNIKMNETKQEQNNKFDDVGYHCQLDRISNAPFFSPRAIVFLHLSSSSSCSIVVIAGARWANMATYTRSGFSSDGSGSPRFSDRWCLLGFVPWDEPRRRRPYWLYSPRHRSWGACWLWFERCRVRLREREQWRMREARYVVEWWLNERLGFDLAYKGRLGINS